MRREIGYNGIYYGSMYVVNRGSCDFCLFWGMFSPIILVCNPGKFCQVAMLFVRVIFWKNRGKM